MTVVFAGGGTGGHLYPAIAIADALRERGASIAFVGTADRLETTIVPQAGYALHTVASRPLTRAGSSTSLGVTVASRLQAAAANLQGAVQSLGLLSKLRPDLVVATGGYVCFPVVAAARMLRTVRALPARIALVEPNATPGLTNRLLAPLVDEVWGAFAQADRRFGDRYVQTGIPVRASLRALPSRADAIARLGLRPDCPTLVAVGGSQGARTINDALIALVTSGNFPSNWQLLHLAGERDYDRVRDALDGAAVVRPYLNEMADAYAAADLVVARAGASTLGELAAVGKPAILVPYPHAADDHQAANAARFAATGAAVVVTDRELGTDRLLVVLREVTAPSRLAELTGAARRLQHGDPVATILARVDVLVTRKTKAS